MYLCWQLETKYEGLCKDLKRLRKCVRRSTLERPSFVGKLKTLLEKEVEELDRETEKLREQVEVTITASILNAAGNE